MYMCVCESLLVLFCTVRMCYFSPIQYVDFTVFHNTSSYILIKSIEFMNIKTTI